MIGYDCFALGPEISVLASIALMLILTLYLPLRYQYLNYYLSQITLLVVALFSWGLMHTAPQLLMKGLFISDPLAGFFKMALSLFGLMVFAYARNNAVIGNITPVVGSAAQQSNDSDVQSHYFILCLFSILGMMILSSAAHFLSLYLGLELMILPLYALMSLYKKEKALEASLKYFLLGVLSSAFLLYGISLLYGMTGDLNIRAVIQALPQPLMDHPAAVGGILFILFALFFKLGVVPFHVWLPDLYEGSASPVTLFLGTLPKIAALAFATRFLAAVLPLSFSLQALLMVFGLVCLVLGHLAALSQRNIKRLLAYSAIAQVGFMLLALGLGVEEGFAFALYYLGIYVLAVLAFLGLLAALGEGADGIEGDQLQALAGLGQQAPWIGCVLAMVLLSLVGIPPFAGFYAKLFIIKALMSQGLSLVALLALVLTVVGAFYYLRMISLLFFHNPTQEKPKKMLSPLHLGLFSFNGLAVLWLGIFPAPLLGLCHRLIAASL